MHRCPCCNARLNGQDQCSRCKADLSLLTSVEQAARFWLTKAIEYYLAEKIEQSVDAISVSLDLKKTRLALVFREFIIQQQAQEILDLLAQSQLMPARKRIYQIRLLPPHSQLLQQICTFSEYLFVQGQDCSRVL